MSIYSKSAITVLLVFCLGSIAAAQEKALAQMVAERFAQITPVKPVEPLLVADPFFKQAETERKVPGGRYLRLNSKAAAEITSTQPATLLLELENERGEPVTCDKRV